MGLEQPKIQGSSIVLIGDFNPKIFQPAWFAAEGLIQRQEAEQADIVIIHPEVVSFALDWLGLQVTRERFEASTTQESYYEVIRDLVVGTFKLLRHTPIRMMGINTEMHFQVKSVEAWHAFGHRLTPKDLWKDVLQNPGMIDVTMIESVRRDGLKGYIRVQVQPSVKVHPGVFFSVNDHYQVENPDSALGSDEIISILERSWSESLKRSKEIIYSLLEKQ